MGVVQASGPRHLPLVLPPCLILVSGNPGTILRFFSIHAHSMASTSTVMSAPLSYIPQTNHCTQPLQFKPLSPLGLLQWSYCSPGFHSGILVRLFTHTAASVPLKYKPFYVTFVLKEDLLAEDSQLGFPILRGELGG